MKRIAIVPVKRLSEAKMRLSQVLLPNERRLITEMMLKDVLQALRNSQLLDNIIVIGADPSVKRLAEKCQARFVKEPSVGLNTSIEYATRLSLKHGTTSVLVVLADIPLVDDIDIKEVVRLGLDAAVVLSPSRAEGTNALLRTPPEVIKTEYGHRSFVSHLRHIQERGISFRTLWTPSLSFDVDTPGDLWELLQKPASTYTSKFLEEIEMRRRLIRYWRKIKRVP